MYNQSDLAGVTRQKQMLFIGIAAPIRSGTLPQMTLSARGQASARCHEAGTPVTPGNRLALKRQSAIVHVLIVTPAYDHSAVAYLTKLRFTE
jgi:hypothetical protein